MPTLVRHLDAWGYERYWATEHHSPHQSASPVVAAAVAAATASRICVGTAGIMLRYANPLRVAKDAHLLELLYPGRIDLGTIGGYAASPESGLHRALSAHDSDENWYQEAYADLARYVRDPEQRVDGSAMDICRSRSIPRLWLCSNSLASAVLAGQQSVGFIFHLPQAFSAGLRLAVEVIDRYRAAFVPTLWMPAPRVAVVCAGICAETTVQARDLWPGYVARTLSLHSIFPKSRADIPWYLQSPLSTFFIGDPDQCRAHICEMAVDLSADEVIVYCATDSFGTSIRGYELLSQAFQLH